MRRRRTALDEAFDAFVLGSQRRLVHVADLLVADRSLAEDLVQEGYVRAYAAWPRIHDGSPEAYVRRCVVNLAHDWRRKKSSGEQPTLAVDDRATEGEERSVVERLAVLQTLSVLSERERQVVVLRYYADLSEAQIAHELEVAVGTVKSTAARALGRLRDNVRRDPEASDV